MPREGQHPGFPGLYRIGDITVHKSSFVARIVFKDDAVCLFSRGTCSGGVETIASGTPSTPMLVTTVDQDVRYIWPPRLRLTLRRSRRDIDDQTVDEDASVASFVIQRSLVHEKCVRKVVHEQKIFKQPQFRAVNDSIHTRGSPAFRVETR